ncbi:MAG: hypothetical protein VX160_09525, partial [Actinomycetota bacterium]|nr:hypothetical protein [Actinomycetota bacterium]
AIYALAGIRIIAVIIGLTQAADVAVRRHDTVAIDIFTALIRIRVTLATFTATAERLVGIITLKIVPAGAAPSAIGALIANRRVTTTSDITKQLTNPTFAFRAHRKVGVIAMLIQGALTALTSISARQAEWCVSATAHIAFKSTRLALTLFALLSTRLVAITGVTTAYAEDAKLLLRAEW